MQSSNRNIIYKCNNCGREVGKPNLRVKRVQFCEMGTNGRVLKTRATQWLCAIVHPDGTRSCMDLDPDFNRVARYAAPGSQDVVSGRA